MLVAADVALAVVLLIGAGLMIKSVGRLLDVHPGFDPDHVLTMQISMVGQPYRKDEAVVAEDRRDAWRRSARCRASKRWPPPGQIPLGGNGDTWGFHVEHRTWGPEDPSVERYSVTPDYFTVMRIPLRRGRLISDADRAGVDRVMVIGERTAERIWPDADPIGQRVKIGGFEGPVVHDRRHRRRRASQGAVGADDDADVHVAGAADRLVSDVRDSIERRSLGARAGGAPRDLVGRERRAGL